MKELEKFTIHQLANEVEFCESTVEMIQTVGRRLKQIECSVSEFENSSTITIGKVAEYARALRNEAVRRQAEFVSYPKQLNLFI